jgi:hypothetical protein
MKDSIKKEGITVFGKKRNNGYQNSGELLIPCGQEDQSVE